MKRLTSCQRTLLIGAILLAFQPAAQAAPAPQDAVDAYYKSCVDSVKMPKPFGEWDLKGNAKLPKYCECFAPRFAERAMEAARFMQQNPGKPQPGTLEQTNKEELAMRNTCRKQLGLPAAKAPN